MTIDRREFLKFLGVSSISAQTFISCSNFPYSPQIGIEPSLKDVLTLDAQLSWRKIISWGEKINPESFFGFNNDYLNFHVLNDNEIILWTNHEYINPIFVSGHERTKENVDKEIKAVGGSLIHLKKKNNSWHFQPYSKYNRRVDGFQMIPFSNNQKIRGKYQAMGTLGNCAGGKTPWGTILTCEENYDYCYGERSFKDQKFKPSYHKWEKFYNNPPEHYGWVVEVDPLSGDSVKRVELGRFAHESATVVRKNGKLVVYSGDDKAGEHLYKFVSDSSENLDKGTLFVASLEQGKWLALDVSKNSELKKIFKNQLNVLTYAREAAKVLGATPLDRPEDIEIHPHTGDVYIALTNNKKAENYHGKILKISESNNDYASMNFTHSDFLIGGKEQGFSCPDNLVFDQKGNLWFATDISGKSIGKKEYESFGNNGLFVVPIQGENAGKVIQVASAPVDAELTGICFDPSYDKLFLSVQHPGERTKSLDKPTSLWPNDGSGVPKPSVIEVTGVSSISWLK